MICFFCHRPIRGSDTAQRYEWRLSPDRPGHPAVYGKGELPLAKAYGRLLKVAHNKCYHAEKKRLELTAARDADPSAQSQPDQDWRQQTVVSVEDL